MTRTALADRCCFACSVWAADPGPYRSAGFVDIPPQVKLDAVSAVEVDSKGRIYVLHRGEPPLLQFDKDGKLRERLG